MASMVAPTITQMRKAGKEYREAGAATSPRWKRASHRSARGSGVFLGVFIGSVVFFMRFTESVVFF